MSTQTNDQQPTYATTAADLRRMADALERVGHRDDLDRLWISIGIQPMAEDSDEDLTVRTVDAVAAAMFDQTGEAHRMSDGSWHHDVSGRVGELYVSVYGQVTPAGVR